MERWPAIFWLACSDPEAAKQLASKITNFREGRLKPAGQHAPPVVAQRVRVQVDLDDFLPSDLLALYEAIAAGDENEIGISIRTRAILKGFLATFRASHIVKIEPAESRFDDPLVQSVGDEIHHSPWSEICNVLWKSHQKLVVMLVRLDRMITPERIGIRRMKTSLDSSAQNDLATGEFDLKEFHNLLNERKMVPLTLLTAHENKKRPSWAFFTCDIHREILPCLKIELVYDARSPLKLEAKKLKFLPGFLLCRKDSTWPVKVTMGQTEKKTWAADTFQKVLRIVLAVESVRMDLAKSKEYDFHQPEACPTVELGISEKQNLLMLMFGEFWDRSEFGPIDKRSDLAALSVLRKADESVSSISTKIRRLGIQIRYRAPLSDQE